MPGGPGIVSAPQFHVARPEAEIPANAERQTGPLLCLTWKGHQRTKSQAPCNCCNGRFEGMLLASSWMASIKNYDSDLKLSPIFKVLPKAGISWMHKASSKLL